MGDRDQRSLDAPQRAQYRRNEGIFSPEYRRRRHEEKVGLEQINKRALKRNQAFIDSFETNDINPLNNFYLRHAKSIAYIVTEAFHNTAFHFVETAKVRSQARNLVSGDVSHYFKNKVETKPLISGVVSGFLGATAGATAFISMYNFLTIQLYCNSVGSGASNLPSIQEFSLVKRIQDWDFRMKNLLIYAVSDATGSIFKAQFEVRKMLIQMYIKD